MSCLGALMQTKYARITSLLVLFALLLLGAYSAWGYFKDAKTADTAPATAVEAPFVDTTDEDDLLPDLVPLPPRELQIKKTDDGRTLLYFSTTYYNQGRGTVELRADPATAGIRSDINRDVFQRIYRADKTHRDVLVGNFMWHQEHLHYHFSDFITYDLEAVDAPANTADLSSNLVKSTFCLRDISTVDLLLPNRAGEAVYKICGKELQGVSVGWGDTYYWDYPAQNLDISELASGTYRLKFLANPALNLEEIRYDNNASSALFTIDMEKLTVKVLEEVPKVTPPVEHIHLEDPFGL